MSQISGTLTLCSKEKQGQTNNWFKIKHQILKQILNIKSPRVTSRKPPSSKGVMDQQQTCPGLLPFFFFFLNSSMCDYE